MALTCWRLFFYSLIFVAVFSFCALKNDRRMADTGVGVCEQYTNTETKKKRKASIETKTNKHRTFSDKYKM